MSSLPEGLPRFERLALDVNAAPLYSVYVEENAFPPSFLKDHFWYKRNPLTGETLMQWLSDPGAPEFEALLEGYYRGTKVSGEGVNLREALYSTLNILLSPHSPPRPRDQAVEGTFSAVKWSVLLEGDNVPGGAHSRPPAIGLAHELMHAYHNTRGDAPGYDIDNSFGTTAAELQATGIIPFDKDEVSENVVRSQWGKVNNPPPDQSQGKPGNLARADGL